MKEITIWLTYDLGVGGDFPSIYSWLDDKKAVECGNNVAYLIFRCPDNINSDEEFVKFLKSELEEKIKFKPGNRIYIVRKAFDQYEQGKTIGSFVIGKRKANPWEGFGETTENKIDG
ncbi:MAG: hypothetical protein LBR34_12035 [Prevotella sp.]|jgi:hypothetical protein|nr:hypothetical protein [Prevotella sp.]